jgi:hypothetical protein
LKAPVAVSFPKPNNFGSAARGEVLVGLCVGEETLEEKLEAAEL